MKDVQLEEVDDGIFSCLDKTELQSDYDSKVGAYDLVVGNRFYNRIVWGNRPSDYREFCKQALAGTPGGIYLDAGCGSLVPFERILGSRALSAMPFNTRSIPSETWRMAGVHDCAISGDGNHPRALTDRGAGSSPPEPEGGGRAE